MTGVQTCALPISLMLLHKLFMDTKKLLQRAGANPGFGDGAEFKASKERQPILGILGRRPQWYLVAKPLVRSGGFAPPEADELSANEILIS